MNRHQKDHEILFIIFTFDSFGVQKTYKRNSVFTNEKQLSFCMSGIYIVNSKTESEEIDVVHILNVLATSWVSIHIAMHKPN